MNPSAPYGETLSKLNPLEPQYIHSLLLEHTGGTGAVCDIGCGRGATLQYLAQHPGFTLYGIEPEAAYCAQARQACPTASITQATAQALPFADASLDAVLLECVFSLLESPKAALDEAFRCIRPGGILLLGDLYLRAANEPVELTNSTLLRHLYTRLRLEALCTDAGFAPLHFSDHSRALTSMYAQMIMDDTACDCAELALLKSIRHLKPGYALWIGKP